MLWVLCMVSLPVVGQPFPESVGESYWVLPVCMYGNVTKSSNMIGQYCVEEWTAVWQAHRSQTSIHKAGRLLPFWHIQCMQVIVAPSLAYSHT